MARTHRILVVADHPLHSRLLGSMLGSLGYELELASDGVEALGKLTGEIDLVLLDVVMSGLDGCEVTRRIRADGRFRDLPVIMVTAMDSREDRVRAVEAGASDFIGKPVDRIELRVRISSQLTLKDAQDALKRHGAQLELLVAARTQALRTALDETSEAHRRTHQAHLDTIQRLVLATSLRDGETAEHVQRISLSTEVLARWLELPLGEVEILSRAAAMHDIGKIGIPDAILLKKGPLTPGERRIMESHTLLGARLLAGSPSALIQAGAGIALTHHERWDGTGYPRGLAGTNIPLGGRICAVVDVFDALTSDRPYRQALPLEEALKLMGTGRSCQFDPDLFDAFESCRAEILQVREDFRAGSAPRAYELSTAQGETHKGEQGPQADGWAGQPPAVPRADHPPKQPVERDRRILAGVAVAAGDAGEPPGLDAVAEQTAYLETEVGGLENDNVARPVDAGGRHFHSLAVHE
jgi:putative two-component system response regulator